MTLSLSTTAPAAAGCGQAPWRFGRLYDRGYGDGGRGRRGGGLAGRGFGNLRDRHPAAIRMRASTGYEMDLFMGHSFRFRCSRVCRVILSAHCIKRNGGARLCGKDSRSFDGKGRVVKTQFLCFFDRAWYVLLPRMRGIRTAVLLGGRAFSCFGPSSTHARRRGRSGMGDPAGPRDAFCVAAHVAQKGDGHVAAGGGEGARRRHAVGFRWRGAGHCARWPAS